MPLLLREAVLLACCQLCEGAQLRAMRIGEDDDDSSRCLLAVLGDAAGRLVAFGGRRNARRSLASVLTCYVMLFLRGRQRSKWDYINACTHGGDTRVRADGIAGSSDGRTVFLTRRVPGHAACEIVKMVLDTGVCERAVELAAPAYVHQVAATPTQLFVATGAMVSVWCTTTLRLVRVEHVFVKQRLVVTGLCVDDTQLAVVDARTASVHLFRRTPWARVCSFGQRGHGAGDLCGPAQIVFLARGTRIAVAERGSHRVSVFSTCGAFLQHVGAGSLAHPHKLAVSSQGELVVADKFGVKVFGALSERIVETFHRTSLYTDVCALYPLLVAIVDDGRTLSILQV